MKYLFPLTTALFIMTFSFAQQPTDDPTVVTIDETVIKLSEMQEMLMNRFGRQLQQVPPDQQKEVMQRAQQMVMEDLISRTLLLNAADKQGIKITEKELDERITEVTAGLSGDMTLDQVLASAGMTLEEMKARLSEDSKWDNYSIK